MRRAGLIVALGALLGMLGAAVTASPALAGRGHKWELTTSADLTLPASLCGFKIRLTEPVNKEYSKILKTPDGSMTFLVTGFSANTFTNLSTGKSITENVSGPGKITVFADGSVLFAGKGHGAIELAPADAQRFGLPTLFVAAGAFTQSIAADGTITSATLHGHVAVNVCTALS